MVKSEVGCGAIEPCGDAPEFVGQFAVEGREFFSRIEQSGIVARGAVELRQLARAPSGLESTVVEGNTAEWSEVEMDSAGPTQLIESTLPGEGDGQGTGAVADVGSLFEPFVTGQRGDPLGKWFEQEVGLTGEAPHRPFDDEAVLIGIDAASAGTHRDSELCCSAGSLAERSLADSAGAPSQRH